MGKPKRVIGFRVGTGNGSSHGYRHLSIEVRPMYETDMMTAVKQSITASYADQYLKEAAAVYRETGDTVALKPLSDDCELEFTWQDDTERRDQWYGARLEMRRPDDTSVALLNQIHKAGGSLHLESDPKEFLRALRSKLKARPMRYFSEGGHGCWIEDKDWDIDALSQQGISLREVQG
jgi:hypothetical protein